MASDKIHEGVAAPDFEFENDRGEIIRLGDLKGKPVVVYFYPRDDTSGCTRQAVEFTQLIDSFSSLDVKIIGVSPDTAASHEKFKAKHNLKLQLAADTKKIAAQAYGVWVSKSMYGRQYMGVERSTFLIGADGTIARIWRKVRVPGHAERVLEAVQSLSR